MGEEHGENTARKSAFSELRHDRLILAFLVIVLILGTTVRLMYPADPGLWNDDMSIIPTAVQWFYPHANYPGLSAQGEPALSNYIIGRFCMLSGQDFSNSSYIQPVWFADRPVLLGEQIAAAEDYCRIPMYIFAIIFLFAITLLCFILLDKYSALYATTFFAFYPFVLQYSRWLHADIILLSFLALGIIFLFKFYTSEKESKKEMLFFCIAMSFFALSLATKLPPAVYAFFAIALLCEKYKETIFLWIKMAGASLGIESVQKLKDAGANAKRLITVAISGIIVYMLVLLPPYEFNLKNIWLVAKMYRETAGSLGHFSLNSNILHVFNEFWININILDLMLLVFALFVFIALLLRKKDAAERFIFYLSLMFIAVAIVFPTTSTLRIFTSFAFGIFFLMALGLSSRPYSVFGIFGISGRKMRIAFFSIFILYLVVASFIAFSTVPYFEHRNWVACKLIGCETQSYAHMAESQTGEYLREVLKGDDEYTFELLNLFHMTYFYIHSDHGYLALSFREAVRQQLGRVPLLEERIQYYHPNNLTVRYIVIDPLHDYNDAGVDKLKSEFAPNHKIILRHDIEAVWIYDLKNLIPKSVEDI